MRSSVPRRRVWLSARHAAGFALGFIIVRLALPGPGFESFDAEPAIAPVTTPTRPAPIARPYVASDSSAGNGPAGEPRAQAKPDTGRAPDVGVAPESEKTPCPEGMALVSGMYCPEVVHTCVRWLDDERLPFARCAEYALEARCKAEKQALRYCMDRREFTVSGEELPLNHQSFMKAEALCHEVGKRVCTEREWNFACEGEQMLPYPYGHQRRPICNQDRTDLYEDNARRQVLKDNRRPSGSMPECQSPFGVFDMVGNLDEPVLREAQRGNYPFRNGLKGGWWMAGRNRCRPATTAHDDHYHGIQIGIRCCRDVTTLIAE